jgi:predicted kinase
MSLINKSEFYKMLNPNKNLIGFNGKVVSEQSVRKLIDGCYQNGLRQVSTQKSDWVKCEFEIYCIGRKSKKKKHEKGKT